MKIAVIDTETTGLEDSDQVVELAVVMLNERGDELSQWSSLVRPTVPIRAEARATHHIGEEDLDGVLTMNALQPMIPDLTDVVLVAHYLDFDLRMLAQSGFPADVLSPARICTWRCARHLWPNAPRHSNQVLRYWLPVAVPVQLLPPHRALPDAVVTAHILRHMLKTHTIKELIGLTNTLPILHKVPMGKHRDQPWSEVPFDYLEWVISATNPPFGDEIRHTALHWRRVRQRRWLKKYTVQQRGKTNVVKAG